MAGAAFYPNLLSLHERIPLTVFQLNLLIPLNLFLPLTGNDGTGNAVITSNGLYKFSSYIIANILRVCISRGGGGGTDEAKASLHHFKHYCIHVRRLPSFIAYVDIEGPCFLGAFNEFFVVTGAQFLAYRY